MRSLVSCGKVDRTARGCGALPDFAAWPPAGEVWLAGEQLVDSRGQGVGDDSFDRRAGALAAMFDVGVPTEPTLVLNPQARDPQRRRAPTSRPPAMAKSAPSQTISLSHRRQIVRTRTHRDWPQRPAIPRLCLVNSGWRRVVFPRTGA
jgi:hypothetical protein